MTTNNKAFVAYLRNIARIQGADNIVQADVVLNGIKITQVVASIGTLENTKIVYFDSNMCLLETILTDYPDLGRYLSKGGRVRVVKLRGIISNGLAVKVEDFYKYTDAKMFKEGFEFTSLGSVEICKKYTPPPARNSGSNQTGKKIRKPKVSRMIDGQFHFHVNTDQLLRNAHKISGDDVISITHKIHGTSAIVSNCLVRKPKTSLLEKLMWWVKDKIYYDYIYSSRSVIKNDAIDDSGYYSFDLWTDAGSKYFRGKLHSGETVYYEIYGYLPTGGYIQKGYDYDCAENEYKIAVYRITKTGPDGHVVEYGWSALKDRCRELAVPHVTEFYFGKASAMYPELKEFNPSDFVSKLKQDYLEKDCKLSKNKVPDEGICLRVEAGGIQVYKLKSEKFLLGESKAKDDGVVDLEEEQAQEEEVVE